MHNHYTLNDTRALELLPLARQKGIGIINGSPFGSGLLSGREAPDWHPATEADRRLFREAAALCEQHGVPISKLALQFSSQNPDLPTTLFSSSAPSRSGATSPGRKSRSTPLCWRPCKRILAPVMNKQWDYDAAVDNMRSAGAGVHRPTARGGPGGGRSVGRRGARAPGN